ncbi:MAG: TerB family tellurite resistance protein [Planctomycetes bacterium]|nr:TerB family tellurite resistance protein [Planctomycetota bacterium]
MQQIESGEKISFLKALKEAFVLDFLKMIPIAAIWAFLWLIILILKSGGRKKSGGRAQPSTRDAARTLAGADSTLSFFSLGLIMIEKLIRMIVFLTLPAIAWENKGPFSSIKQSFRIFKKHPVQFMTTYTLTGIIAIIMALPLCIIFTLDKKGVTFSAAFWTGVIIYEAIIWTLGIYFEQMSVALLYFWHLRWEECGSQGELSSIPKPDLLDNVYELKHLVSESVTDESAETSPEKTVRAAELKFRTACQSALADGKLSLDEKHELATLGKSLKMSKQDIIRIFEDEKKSFRSGQEVAPIQNVELRFRQACREALADGKVTTEEKRQLKSLAEFFNIPRGHIKQMLKDEISKN